MVKRYGVGTIAAVCGTVLIWSTTFAALVVALRHFSPEHLLFIRWTLTAALFAGFAVVTRMRPPALADLPKIAAAGVLGVGAFQLLLVNGQTGVTASMAGFLINLAPVFTTVIAVTLKRDKSTWMTWAGIGLCTVGLAAMGQAAGGLGRIGPSAGLVIGAALCFALYTIVTKPLLARYRPLEVAAYATIAGSLPFVIFAPGSWAAVTSAPPVALFTVVILAVFHGCIAYVLWAYAVSGMTPGVAARFLYLVPVIGVGVAWAWVAEVPSALTVAGGLLTVVGVSLSSMGGRGTLKTPAHLSAERSTQAVAAPVSVPEPA